MGTTSETGSASNFSSIQLGGNGSNADGTQADTPLKGFKVYTQSLDVASVAANTSAEQTFTVNGLTTADVVMVSKPSLSAGLVVSTARVSATNTLAITFGNLTASPIDPAAESYKITAFRV